MKRFETLFFILALVFVMYKVHDVTYHKVYISREQAMQAYGNAWTSGYMAARAPSLPFSKFSRDSTEFQRHLDTMYGE